MPSRRTHQKSRLGCLQCKRRRVKCDEQWPRCSSCTVRGVQCEYATSGSLIWPKQPHTPPARPRQRSRDVENAIDTIDLFNRLVNNTNSTSSSVGSNGAAPLPTPVPNIRDLELMVQWSTSTSLTLARDEKTRHIWQVVVPREAVSHLYLLHAILAFSALHLSRSNYKNQADMYLAVAASHQSQSLALFRPLLEEDVTAANANAVFTVAAVFVAFAFGFPQPSFSSLNQVGAEEDPLAPVDDLCRAMSLSRGMQAPFGASRELLRDGELSHLMQLDHHTPFLPADVKLAMDALRSRNEAYGRQDPHHHETEVYVHTIDQLGLTLERLHGGCPRASLAVLFPVKVPERFMELLRAHAPMALATLAHYCVVLQGLEEHWYLEDWAPRVVSSIWESFDAEWRASIRWVMDVTGVSTAT